MPTIYDVARKASVSVMTVSRVLNKPEKVSAKTIERIHSVMNELGYQPSHVARSLVKKKTNIIGIIMPDIKNTFFNSWFRSVENYARQFGYNTFLCNTDEDSEHEMQFARSFQAHRVDGILIVPHSDESVRYLIRSGTNLVLVDRMYEDIQCDFVVTDHRDGAFKLTQYLIGLGHKKIGVLRGPGFLFPDVQRYDGFRDAMIRNGIEPAQQFICNCEFREAEAFRAVTEMLTGHDRPTAIFSFNSLMTIGAIKAIEEMHLKIPDDVSLACYDEIPGYDIFEPRITHVLQPIDKLGQAAAQILIDKIENKYDKKNRNVFLKPELIVGNSCKSIS